MKKLKVILIGAGGRGKKYTNTMDNERFTLVGVAEPIADRRNYIKEKHHLSDEMCFEMWEPLLDLPKIADIAIIATTDRHHYGPAMKAIEKGYDILLEKPISPEFSECVEIMNAAKKKGVKILVCHVLRYSVLYKTIKKMIDENKIGRVMSIHYSECVGNHHQSHSFVRGNSGNSDRGSSMILQKSCHDMDIIQWFVGRPCKKVQSFGSLTYFTAENAPEGSPDYCDKTCPVYDTCYYNAVKLYTENKENMWFRETAASKVNPSDEEVAESLKRTQYGKCVYKCDNNVVDHQVVNLEFDDGTVASFNMCAFNKGGRFIRIMGTDGEIYADSAENTIQYFSFKSREKEFIDFNDTENPNSVVYDHGGGDLGIIDAMYDYIANGCVDDSITEIEISTKNHLIAFAAEKSRLEGNVIDLKDLADEFGFKM